jgi:hypothetical protein
MRFIRQDAEMFLAELLDTPTEAEAPNPFATVKHILGRRPWSR